MTPISRSTGWLLCLPKGFTEGNFAPLNLNGLQRFRLRFLAIGRPGDCRIGLDEISITPKIAP